MVTSLKSNASWIRDHTLVQLISASSSMAKHPRMSESATDYLSLDTKASLHVSDFLQHTSEFRNWAITAEWKAWSTSTIKSSPVNVSPLNLGTLKVGVCGDHWSGAVDLTQM